ncbi:MAG TPA: hypothetical protein VHU80_09735 [Polyangiaceae bacterium]|nr:hypothetical protein [Polyangiaceae bacterium]
MNRAGGLFYHARAVRSAGARWRPFRDALGQWLNDVFDPAAPLVVVGPSAGYCLPDAFLARFDDVTALEPDPVARWLLARRARRLGIRSLELVSEDRLVAPLLTGMASGLDAMLGRRPTASVLFANVLGQIRFLLTDGERGEWQRAWTKRLAPLLARRTWASFHDRVSSASAPAVVMPHRTSVRLSDAALGRTFYGHLDGRIELLDHLTERLFPAGIPHAYFHWELDRSSHHLVEAVAHRPSIPVNTQNES